MCKSLFIFLVFLLTTRNATGLELFLDLDVKVLPGDLSTCGVLYCKEEGKEPRLSEILEMTVFKRREDDANRGRRTVASVSKSQPEVSAFWDGIKVDGSWGKQRSELSLYLVERDDCRLAEFSCEVHFVDGLEQKRVSFAQLGRMTAVPSIPHSSPEGACATPTNVGFLQLSSLLQQSSTTMQSTVNQLQGRLEDKVHNIENRLEDKINTLKRIGIPGGDQNVQDRIETSLNSLNELTDRLIGLIKVSQTSATLESTEEKSLVPRTSCERQEGRYQMVIPIGGDGPYLCDIQTEGGGWIVIQRRSTGNVDFYRNWSAYKKGFGSLADDFWLGNDKIHALTSSGSYELLVSLQYGNETAFAHYQSFSISDEASNYTLHVGGYDGTAGDSLSAHNDNGFSTYDKDNDQTRNNCAVMYSGAWWYTQCHISNLNGAWGAFNNKGPRWSTLTQADPVSYSEMKIRQV